MTTLKVILFGAEGATAVPYYDIIKPMVFYLCFNKKVATISGGSSDLGVRMSVHLYFIIQIVPCYTCLVAVVP